MRGVIIILKIILSKFFKFCGYEIKRSTSNFNQKKNQFYTIKSILNDYENIIIFDVGANKGEMTKIYRTLLPKSYIYAFEPIPKSYDDLSKLSISDPKTFTYRLAISNKTKRLKFNINQNHKTSSLLKSEIIAKKYWGNNELKTVKIINVDCIKIDDFCNDNNIKYINFLKLDIQGSELDALKGAKNLFENKKIQIIYTEISIFNSYLNQGSFPKIVSYLYKYNFELFDIYKVIRRKGRLMEIDAMFINKKFLK